MTNFKNFDEWRAKKQFSDTLASDLKMCDENDSKIDMRGFIYPDGAWIELKDSGKWHTIVANTEEFFYDLRQMEHYLWSVHSSSNITTPRDEMIDELERYCKTWGLPHLSADELLTECQVKRNTYKTHVDWLAGYLSRWEKLED